MKCILGKLASPLVAACAWAGTAVFTAAHAVNDLPGGPAVNQLNLHPAVTRIAHEQAWLHWFMMIVCTVIFIAVFSVMFYSIWKHRKSVGHKAATFHESVTVEIVWTIVPFIIVILMALPATKVVVAMKDTTNADLTIRPPATSGSGATTTSRAKARAFPSSPRWTARTARSPMTAPRAPCRTTTC